MTFDLLLNFFYCFLLLFHSSFCLFFHLSSIFPHFFLFSSTYRIYIFLIDPFFVVGGGGFKFEWLFSGLFCYDINGPS